MPEHDAPEPEAPEPDAPELTGDELPRDDAPEHTRDEPGDEPGDEFLAVIDEPDGSIAEVVYEADPVLLAAVDQARAALAEIAPAETIGEVVGHAVEGEHLLSLFFESKLPGYPDWHWTATLARVDENTAPTVLEVEMLPGESSVLSPAWVPWADRTTPDALIDDSESEFDDDDLDDVDDENSEGEASDDDPDGDDRDEDGPDSDELDDDDDGEDDDEADVEPAPDVVAALALRRDRDGIDIDTIADEGVAFDATDDFTDAGDIEGIDPDERAY